MEPELDGDVIETKNESNRAFGCKVMKIYISDRSTNIMFTPNTVPCPFGNEQLGLVRPARHQWNQN